MRRAYEKCNMLGKLEKRTALEGSKKVIEVTRLSSDELRNILICRSTKT